MDKCPLDKCRGDSCNLMYMFPGPFVKSLIKIGPVTAEILQSKSLCGGWWVVVVVVCKPILVFSLSLGQAEQNYSATPCHENTFRQAGAGAELGQAQVS